MSKYESLNDVYLSTDNMTYLIERYIDERGLVNAIDCLVEICHGKASHLQENWNDTAQADLWLRAASILGTAQTRPAMSELSKLMR